MRLTFCAAFAVIVGLGAVPPAGANTVAIEPAAPYAFEFELLGDDGATLAIRAVDTPAMPARAQGLFHTDANGTTWWRSTDASTILAVTKAGDEQEFQLGEL